MLFLEMFLGASFGDVRGECHFPRRMVGLMVHSHVPFPGMVLDSMGNNVPFACPHAPLHCIGMADSLDSRLYIEMLPKNS